MANEFSTKPNNITPAAVGQLANPDDYNQNIAAQSKGAIVGIDGNGSYADADFGDETLGTNGALINNLKLREGGLVKIYNASGVFQNNVNLGQATESLIGQAEIATQTESNTGTDDTRFITPLKLKTRQGKRYVGRLTASSSASLSQALSTGSRYEFVFVNILPANNAVMLTAQYSVDGGSSWINSSYLQRSSFASTSDAEISATNKTSGLTINGNDNDGNTGAGNNSTRGGINGEFILYNPSNSSYKQAKWNVIYSTTTSLNYQASTYGTGIYQGATTAINAIQFLFKTVGSDTNNGNIASGYIDVYEYND